MARHAALLLPFLTILPIHVHAQSSVAHNGARVEILGADEWSYDERIAPGAQRLKGNVRFRHANALLYCDSAYLYNDQRVDAFGRVRIHQGDSLRVSGDRLRYNGQDRIARMEGNVVLEDPSMRLTAPSLDHDLRARRAVYSEGAEITGHDGGVLTSVRGTYLTDERLFIFSRRVRMDHPERLITGDTMHYGATSGIADLFGPTTILLKADSTVIRTRRGTYDTVTGQACFTGRSNVSAKGRTLKGDQLEYDKRTGIAMAWGNVSVIDTAASMTATGEYGLYDERTENTLITGRAELVMEMSGDTLFLHGDTLFTSQAAHVDTAGNERRHTRVQAHRNVRFHKSDMQGVCDTLVHSEADSLIRMYHKPVLWSGSDQITGDHIRIVLRDGKAHRMFVEHNAFLISQADSVHFDQVAGTRMTGHLDDDGLRRIIAEGNSRTVYFVREVKDGVEEFIGVNLAECSRIEVAIDDGQVSTVTFLERPDATLYPMGKVPPEQLRMEGAEWREAERPVDRADIFRRP